MSETAAEGFVTLYNSETGQSWDCPEKVVDFWTSRGYRKTDPNKRTGSAGSSSREG